MKCLHCDIVALIAQTVTEAEARGEKVDILPVAYAVAKALGQLIASAAQDRAAEADAEKPIYSGSVH